jgi:hypothetical protein
MTFKRSILGISNYRLFFDAEVVIYTEGRLLTETPIEDLDAYDHKYYTSLVLAFTKIRKVKIKLVGGKSNALDYHDSIRRNEIEHSYVLIDKDYDGLLMSRLQSDKLLTTYGYSWENDFWSEKLCEATLNTLTINNVAAATQFKTKYRRSLARLRKLSCLGAAAHTHETTIFPSGGNSKGIQITAGSAFPISRAEFNRIRIRSHAKGNTYCHCTLAVYSSSRKLPNEAIIQGHLLEHLALNLLGHEYKTATKEKACMQSMAKNVAFSLFVASPRAYLIPPAVDHYTTEFAKIASVP